MIIFGTGSTGFVGQHLFPLLLSRLASEDVLYLLERRPRTYADPRVRVLEGDLQNIERYAAELCQAQWIFHLAGNAVLGQGAVFAEVNREPVRRMIELLRGSCALERFVYVSTIGAMDREPHDRVVAPLTPASTPRPTTDYGRSKLDAEVILRKSGQPFTIFRPGWVYGAGMRRNSHVRVFADLVRRNSPITRMRFPGKAPLIHVHDLCEALANCMEVPRSSGRTYLAVTENRPLGEIFRTLVNLIHGRARASCAIPRVAPLFSRVHRWLPLSVSALFLDYLAADDPDFARDLLRVAPIRFEDGAPDVLGMNAGTPGRWLVTGANSGIGGALVRTLTSRGIPVIALDRTVDALTPSGDVEVIEADLRDADAIARAVRTVSRWPLAALINNAGVGFRGDFLDQSMAEVEATVQVNVLGTLALTHALRSQLVRDGAVIVNVASSVAYHPLPHMAVYAASKAFILNWSLALSEELRPSNRVITFSPSGTRTNFQTAGGVRGGDDSSLLSPEQVAGEILRAIETGRRHTLMGIKPRLLVSGSRFIPLSWKLKVWSRLFSSKR